MEDEQEGRIIVPRAAEDRGAGGKSKKPKRRLSTPYSRPQPWLAKLITPARHLFTGIPTTLSKFGFEFSLPVEPPSIQEQQLEDRINPKNDFSLRMMSKPREIEEARNMQSKFTDISQFISQRTFSREEAERLICILNSKLVECPPKTQEPIVASVNPNLDTNTNPSPIEIAKAYMKSRSSDSSASSHRSPPTQSHGTTTRWPGALSHHDVETSVKRSPIRRPVFERSPYPRYNYLKNESAASQRNETRFGSGSSGPNRSSNNRRWQAEKSSTYERASVGVGLGVPSHSSQLARRILEHLDRNPPTPKEKSDELKIALSGELTIFENSRVGEIGDGAMTERKLSDNFLKDVKDSAPEKVSVPVKKRLLPPISVGFTFPVAFTSDLPTPSIAPVSKSVPSAESVPISYKFGTASSSLDFSFPFVSVSPEFGSMNLHYTFGSNRSSNMCFSFPDVTVST